jgi:hypothetical protein
MRLYGEANGVPGLASGPIETRFARLRETCAADTLVVWTTPARWAGGEGLTLRFPELHLEFTCTLADGHLAAVKVAQVAEEARSPDREPGAVGVAVNAGRIALPPEDATFDASDPGVDVLTSHFARLAGRRWGGFVEPLRAALDAEAADDEARTQRLTVPFKDAALAHGGEEDAWRLKGLPAEALRQLDDGEWLEVLDEQGRSRTNARVVDTYPGQGTIVVGVRASSDPPHAGFIRPRSRRKILEQKRALLDELENPTGSLPHLVRLVATPSAMPTPRPIRPARFINPAVLRNRSQARAVSLALGLDEGQALLIQGPPGTGKSTTAAEIDVQLIARDPGVRVLVCSHSNHGTDNMLMKVLPFLEDAQDRIARIGFYERIAKEARPYYAAPDADLSDKNVIFTTIDALILQDVAGARVYDYVILDEANRAGVLDSLLALARGKRMVLVGDPMQLQPVMSEAEQQIVASANGRHGRRDRAVPVQPGGNNVIGKSLFAWIQERRFSPGATVLLDQQNRMHPAIGELVSRVFYSSRVRTGPAAPRRGTGLTVLPSPVTWVDTRTLRGNVESRAGGTSLFNVAEARLVTSVTRHLASHAPPNLTIGVITAYAEQRDLLRRLMGPHDWPPERQLEIDTVDAFEGREKDIIVLSLVRANRRRDIGFLRLEQRLNVAVSRARRLLIIVGDTSTLRGGYFHHLIATAGSVGAIVPAPRLLGQLLHRGRKVLRRERPGEGEASAAGEALEPGATGVARAEAPGQEGQALPPGSSRRRRRRRALERLRERRAVAAADAEAGPTAPDIDGVPGADVAIDAFDDRAAQGSDNTIADEAQPAADASSAETPPERRRRRRTARRSTPAEAVEVQPVPAADGATDVAPGAEPQDVAGDREAPAPVKRRVSRRRVVPSVPEPDAAPTSDATASDQPPPVVADDAATRTADTPTPRAPRRSRRATPAAAAAPPTADSTAGAPARRTRRRAAADEAAALVPTEPLTPEPPGDNGVSVPKRRVTRRAAKAPASESITPDAAPGVASGDG